MIYMYTHKCVLKENISCQIQPPDIVEAAAASRFQIQSVARMKMYSQQAHAHKANIYIYIHVYINVYMQVYIYALTYIYTRTHTYTHICM